MKFRIAVIATMCALILSSLVFAEEITPYNDSTTQGTDSQGVLYTLDDTTNTAFIGGADRLYNTSLYEDAFDGTVLVPETVEMNGKSYAVTRIEAYAFAKNEKLVAVGLNENLEEIGGGAFAGCTELSELEAYGNFSYADGIVYSADGKTLVLYPAGKTDTYFRVPDEVTAIAPGAFEGVDKLVSLDLNNATRAGDFAFADSSIRSVECKDELVLTGAFSGSKIETALITGSQLEGLGNAAFANCTELKTVVLPKVISIGSDVFNGCSALERVIFCSASNETLKADSLAGLPQSCKIIYRSEKTIFDSYKDSLVLAPSTIGDRYWVSVSQMISANSVFSYASEDGTKGVTFTAKNSTDAEKTVTAYVAFYTSDKKMCDVEISAFVISPYESIINTAETDKTFASYSIILLDGNNAPVGIALTK